MGAILSILIVPLMLLNLFGGIVSGIWLAVKGEWWAVGYGLASMFASHVFLGIAMMPSLLFAAPALVLFEKGKVAMGLPLLLLSQLYTYLIISVWCIAVFAVFLGRASDTSFWPLLIWSYGVALGPWMYMASKEDQNTPSASTMTTVVAQFAYILISGMAIFGHRKVAEVAPVFTSVMLIGMLLQTAMGLTEAFAYRRNAFTAPTQPECVPQPSLERGSFFRRYWRGEVPLAISYWLVSILVNVAIAILSASVHVWGAANKDYIPVQAWVVLTAYWLCALVVLSWQMVGLWRSATVYRERKQGHTIWSWLTKLIVVGTVIRLTTTLSNSVIPQFVEMSKIAFLGDPDIPAYELVVNQDEGELKLNGGIKYGLDSQVRAVLQKNSSLRTVSLESLGGRIAEAEKLFRTFSAAGLNTVVNTYCASACTIAFAGGKERWLGANGQLGFHSASFVGQTREQNLASMRTTLDELARTKGISFAFLKKAFSISPASIWTPNRDELLEAHFITSRHSRALSSLHEIESALRVAAAKVTVPTKIDPATTLIQVRAHLNKLTYVYEVSARVPPTNAGWSHVQRNVKEYVCKDGDMRTAMESGIIYRYEYRDAHSQILSAFELSEC